jgi:hypothetical protein
LGSVNVEQVSINDKLDICYKPGLYEQVNAFLFETQHSSKLLKVEDGLEMLEVYLKMRGNER